ncbi:MAG TPA: zinc ribbon domain-containing protein [Candidatus Acidoferrum sp.]|nr:zinc ribbon domain-containing protein [Candidatus Acidoferrum sp.]
MATIQQTTRRDILVETQTKGDAAATASIASISDQDWYISRTHGVYHIPACPKGLQYALLLITPRGDALDLGDNRRFPFTISAREIADDLLQDLHDHGIFLCAGARPTAEELAAATVRRDAFYQRLVTDGDTMWARGHSFREISDLHRRAAIALGIEREWAYVPVRMIDCPACGEKVKPGVAVCRHCRAILDVEKAAAHGISSLRVDTGRTPNDDRPSSSVGGTHSGGKAATSAQSAPTGSGRQ